MDADRRRGQTESISHYLTKSANDQCLAFAREYVAPLALFARWIGAGLGTNRSAMRAPLCRRPEHSRMAPRPVLAGS
jgi:hypothetical protein